MPFKKESNGKYKSPSGREFTAAQVRLYYATKGFTKKPHSTGDGHKKDKRHD